MNHFINESSKLLTKTLTDTNILIRDNIIYKETHFYLRIF